MQQYRGAAHDCQGSRCVCQRYENGELAVAVMNQNRNNADDGYQNSGRAGRAFQNRAGCAGHPNLNPNYQNPVDLIRNYRGRQQPQQQQHEPEENIYERLDNDDDDRVVNVDFARNDAPAQNNPNSDDHTYERIDDRRACRGGSYSRGYKYHVLNHLPGPSFLNDAEARNLGQYDQPRQIYLDSSRLGSQFCQNRLGRLGRNCFSTENLAYASTSRRSLNPHGYSCVCHFCRHVDARYPFHICHSLHSRLRYQPDASGNGLSMAGVSRHYIYQLPRNCRCPFCRGDYTYVKLPVNASRSGESLRKECHCRNSANCSCRGKLLPSSNSTVHIGRYIDWISRVGPSVNNPLYATIHFGRIDRSCVGSGSSGSAGNDPAVASTSSSSSPASASAMGSGMNEPGTSSMRSGFSANNPTASTSSSSSSASASATISGMNEPGTSSMRSGFSANNPTASTSNASVCTVNRSVERQHTCDDSCIRNQSGNVAGICQFVGRCERAECNHGRLSVHWWLVNKWLPSWHPQSQDKNREEYDSYSDDS